MIKETLADADDRMNKTLEALKHHLATIRTGRAAPALLDRIHVDYYGTPTPINQMASVSVPEARTLMIQPWDRSTMKLIEKAIMQSDLGVTPSNDGQAIRINMPPLTEDRRKQLVKIVHQQVEESKVSIRNIRRDALHQVHKLATDKQISEDDEKRANHQLDEIVKRHTEEADKIGKAKEHEVMEV